MGIALPIIRIEIEHMKHAITQYLSDMQLQWDEMVRTAVEKFCEPGNIQALIQQEANRVIEEALRSEVKEFFLYGDGRVAIRDAVLRILKGEDGEQPYSPL